MPCQVTQAEKDYYDNLSKASEHIEHLSALITYVCECLNVSSPGLPYNVDYLTNILCSLCEAMGEPAKDKIMYNGRIKMARDLAEWWEVHQEFDEGT